MDCAARMFEIRLDQFELGYEGWNLTRLELVLK